MDQGLANVSNMENICKEVQHVYSGDSDQFVPERPQKSVQDDILVAMRRFKNVVKWNKFWRDQKQSTKDEWSEEEEDTIFKATILNRGLSPSFGLKTPKHGSNNI